MGDEDITFQREFIQTPPKGKCYVKFYGHVSILCITTNRTIPLSSQSEFHLLQKIQVFRNLMLFFLLGKYGSS